MLAAAALLATVFASPLERIAKLSDEPYHCTVNCSLVPEDGAAKVVNFKEVKDGMVAFVYNTMYPYSRLAGGMGRRRGGCGWYNGVADKTQMWTLKETAWDNGNSYFLTNYADPKKRYAWSGRQGYCASSAMNQDQAWQFQPKASGSEEFNIINSEHPGCMVINWKDADGGVDCKGKSSIPGQQLFNVKSPFAVVGDQAWTVVDDFENDGPSSVDYTFHFEHGFTESIKNSIATTTALTVSVSATIGAFGSSVSSTTSFEHSVTKSYEKACSSSYLESQTINYKIPPNSHVCMYQFGVSMQDLITNTNFGFQSSKYKLKTCDEGHTKGTTLSLSEEPEGELLDAEFQFY